MHAFASPAAVEETLRALAARPEPLVAERGRQPGQKETRWTHLAAGEPVAVAAPEPAVAVPAGTLADRVARLEAAVARLADELSKLGETLVED